MARATAAKVAAADAPPSDGVRPMVAKTPLLKLGSTGEAVALWRRFLRGEGFALPENPAGLFDMDCVVATRAFQAREGLDIDGQVGDDSWGAAKRLAKAGAAPFKPPPPRPDEGLPTPSDPPLVPFLTAKRRAMLYTAPADWQVIVPGQDEVRFTGGWEEANIARVAVPQLIGIKGARNDGVVRFHALGAARLRALFAAWEAAGLLPQVLTFDGAYNPRMIRGKPKPGADPKHPKPLSNHAFGLAFDINAQWNMLGDPPARRGEVGCLYDLVPIAWAHGFYWGGNFRDRPDGMHFEVGDVPV
jgi:hypothetical protein